MKTRVRQDYKEFINAMDVNETNLLTPIKKKEFTKEEIDALVTKIENQFTHSHFNKDNILGDDNAHYTDPNIFISSFTYPSNRKKGYKNKSNKKDAKIISVPVPPITPGVYSASISYSACLSDLIKEQANLLRKDVRVENHGCCKKAIHPPANKKRESQDKKPSTPVKIILPKTKVNIDVEIKNLDGLIKLIADHPLDETKEYNINMESLHKIHSSLLDLNNMIGMKDLKENVVDQILYFIQDLHKSGDFMHTVIYGPPGTGKTEMAKIIGQIFSKLGILKKGTFKKVTRSDLIAGYLGQTAIKTRDVINECLGGVLFIDEAYALGNSEKKDSFSKECIDTLCEALSNHKDELMVIIAGYESELKECFFNYNQGLDSRFTWRFKTDEYKGEELYNIFLKKVNECKWSIDSDSESKITKIWFEKNLDYFKFFGRDIETLLAKTKIVHGRRVFCKPIEDKMKITIKDLENGFELYLRNDEVKKRKDKEHMKYLLTTMYV
jgi:SpoVK/Ycf46/Vps4 family AAA+-type ATPase